MNNRKQRWITRKLLTYFPDLTLRVWQGYQLAYFPFSRSRKHALYIDKQAKLITPWDWAGVPFESGELFFGYYDKSPWSPMGNRMVFHFRRRKAYRQVEIRVFDREENTCRKIGESSAWNFQQGAMAQWVPGCDGSRVIFNAIVDNRLVARIMTRNGKEESVVSFPIQTIHPNGQKALTLNYKRLSILRPEYGYSPDVKNFSSAQRLEKDGIWQVNLSSGQGELILTLAELLSIAPRSDMSRTKTGVNHIIYSPTGQRFAFMHRWYGSRVKCSRLYIMNQDGTNLHLLLDSQMISHYHWRDDDHLIVYGNTPDNDTTYFLINAVDGSYEIIGKGLLDDFGDGHPSYSPDRRWVLTDTNPDENFHKNLLLYEVQRNELWKVGSFLHSPKFFRTTRCDLHPRWSPDGKKISIDSVWNGSRRSYIVDVSNIVQMSIH